MPRVYSQGKVESGRIADGDLLNTNFKLALETLNGQIDAHNLPIKGFNEASLANSVTGPSGTVQETRGAVNDYYLCTGFLGHTYSDVYDSAWHPVVITFFPKVNLEVVTTGQACVVVGAVQVSGHRVANTDATTSARFGEESTWELGVFVDGNLIAETGEIPSGIYTPHLPFSTQLSAGVHTIEARWKQNLRPISATNTHSAFQTLSSHLWVRAQKR